MCQSRQAIKNPCQYFYWQGLYLLVLRGVVYHCIALIICTITSNTTSDTNVILIRFSIVYFSFFLSFINYGTSLLAYNICVKWEHPSFSYDMWDYLAIIRSSSWVVWCCCITNIIIVIINNVMNIFIKLKFIGFFYHKNHLILSFLIFGLTFNISK